VRREDDIVEAVERMPAGGGSSAKTSTAAPARLPALSAAAKRRLVHRVAAPDVDEVAVGFMAASSGAPIMPRSRA